MLKKINKIWMFGAKSFDINIKKLITFINWNGKLEEASI